MSRENKKIAFSISVIGALFVIAAIFVFKWFEGTSSQVEPIVTARTSSTAKEQRTENKPPRQGSQKVKVSESSAPKSNNFNDPYADEFNEAVSLFNKKQYLDAAALLSDLSLKLPQSGVLDAAAIDSYLSASYYGEALKEFDNKNYDDTVYYTDKAMAVSYAASQEANYLRILANAKYKLNRLSEAISDMEELKGRAGENFNKDDEKFLSDLYFIKSKELYRDGDTPSALLHVRKADLLQPNSEHIQKFLSSLKAQSKEEQNFVSTSTSRFNIKFEGGTNESIGYEISLMLDEIYYKVGGLISYYPPGMTSVVLYSQQDFFDVTGSPSWAGAIYDGQIKMPIGGLEGAGSLVKQRKIIESNLAHEFSHVIVYKLTNGKAPVWFNEGIAQYFEGKRASDHYMQGGNRYRSIANKDFYDLKSLEGSFLKLTGKDAATAYWLSLAAVEYIIDTHGIYKLREILTLLGKGQSMEKALNEALYIGYADINSKFLVKYKQ